MWCLPVLVSLVLTASTARAGKVRYDNHQVLRLTPATQQQVDALKAVEEKPDGVMFWTGVSHVNSSIDVMVSPGKLADFNRALDRLQVNHKVVIEDVQRLIDTQQPGSETRAADFSWDSYHSLEQIYAWLVSLEADYPSVVTVLNLGQSYEGRDILGVKVSYGEGKPGIFLESGIHAREWIAPAVTTYLLDQILSSDNTNVRDIAESFDWYFFPSVNPDGYEYTHTTDRMWRKTRSRGRLLCHGVDANRNWDFHWRGGGSSGFPCSETYDGTGPFSEIESKLVSDYMASLNSTLRIFLSIHSYSQLLLFPYGISGLHAENYDTLMSVAQSAAEAIAQRYGTQYRYGSTVDILYAASGVSPDWAHDVLGIPIAYTIELRDTGDYAFLLPADQILPCAEETLDGLVALVRAANSTF